MTDPRRVRLCQLLLAKAARTNFPAEAEACRQKAQALMAKYDITPEQLVPPRPAPPPQVVHTVIFTGAPIVVVITGSSSNTTTTQTGSVGWWY